MQEEEMFFSGFCKAQNQTRTVLCEFAAASDGRRTLLDTDCAYGTCPHSADCLLMKQAVQPL